MSKSKGKKLVSVPEDLLENATMLSRRKGASVGKFFEDALAQAVRVNSVGYDLKEVADFFDVVQAHKVLGGIFVPSSILNYLVETTYKNDKELLEKKWFESGQWTGKYMKEKSENPIQSLKNFLMFSRWDLNEVDVKEIGNSIRIRCVSTVLSNEDTELLSKFIQGILTGMGLKISKLDSIKGMIILESTK